MAWVAVAVGGGALLTGWMSSNAQSNAANSASNTQAQASQNQINAAKEQFDKIQDMLKPYQQAGVGALGAQQNLLGLNGASAQQQAIDQLASSPQMQAMLKQGENSLLQNASATGGLRGGNTQSALGQFRPQLLNQMIGQQFSNLGGLTSVGQNAAAGVGNAGMQTTQMINAALGQQGAAQAGNALAQGQAQQNLYGSIGNLLGGFGGLAMGGKF